MSRRIFIPPEADWEEDEDLREHGLMIDPHMGDSNTIAIDMNGGIWAFEPEQVLKIIDTLYELLPKEEQT